MFHPRLSKLEKRHVLASPTFFKWDEFLDVEENRKAAWMRSVITCPKCGEYFRTCLDNSDAVTHRDACDECDPDCDGHVEVPTPDSPCLLWPCPESDPLFNEEQMEGLKDLPVSLVRLDWSETWFVPTGGDHYNDWEICQAYILYGSLPPAALVPPETRPFPVKYSKFVMSREYVLEACRRSVLEVHSRMLNKSYELGSPWSFDSEEDDG